MKRSSLVMAGLAVAALLVAAYLLFRPSTALPLDPLAMVPADAYGIVRIKPDRVVKSAAWKRLVVAKGGARGIERVEAECGFNPFAELNELVVFARPAPKGGMPRFAFAARGPLKHEAIIDCLRTMTGQSGGLATEEIEGITTVRSEKGASRAAFIGRDGVIGGDSESVHALINVLVGKGESAASDPLLRGLYADVQQGTDVALVARMPDELVPVLRMVSRVGGAALSPITDVRALGVSATTVDDRIMGGAVIVAKNEADAQALTQLVAMVKERLLDVPGIGLTPANALLNSIKMEASRDHATITGSVRLSAAEMIFDYLPAIGAMAGDASDPAAAAAAAARLLGGGDEPAAGSPAAARPAPQQPEPTPPGTPKAPAQPAPKAPGAAAPKAPAPGTPTIEPLAPAPKRPAAKKP